MVSQTPTDHCGEVGGAATTRVGLFPYCPRHLSIAHKEKGVALGTGRREHWLAKGGAASL